MLLVLRNVFVGANALTIRVQHPMFMLWELWFKGLVKLQQVQHPFRFSISHNMFNKPWLLEVSNWIPKLGLMFTTKRAYDPRTWHMVIIINGFTKCGV
jgi:hypothetical protein